MNDEESDVIGKIEVLNPEEIEEEIFMDEILREYDKVYSKINEGIKIDKRLEYLSNNGYIWSFKRQEKLLLEVVTPSERRKNEEDHKFYFLRDQNLFSSFLINIITKMEMSESYRLK